MKGRVKGREGGGRPGGGGGRGGKGGEGVHRCVVKSLPIAREWPKKILLGDVHQPCALFRDRGEHDEELGDVLAVRLDEGRDMTVLMSAQLDTDDILEGIPNLHTVPSHSLWLHRNMAHIS
eukprot:300092-Hanusia_phi.AAC.2